MNDNEHAIFALTCGVNWYWWAAVGGMAAWNIIGIYKLAQAQSLYGRFIRVVMLLGLMLLSLSPWNPWLSAVGIPLLLISMRMLTNQMYQDCVRRGAAQPFWPTIWASRPEPHRQTRSAH